MAVPPWVWGAVLALLGAVFGSFIAALAIRWPQGRSVLRGRSACDACGRTLAARELVPIVSGIAVGGRCRSCNAPIDPRHGWIELAGLATGAAAGLVLPGPEGFVAAVFGWLLLALAALDISNLWLPDRLTVPLALAGLAGGAAGLAPPLDDRLIGGVAGFGALWAIAFAYRHLRGREGLGGGDPKLLGAIGLWIGWRMLPVVLMLAAATGLAIVLFRLSTGRRVAATDAMPFGALLAIAAYPTLLAMLASLR